VDERTIRVYEEGAQRWRDSKPARFSERAAAMGADLPPGAIRVDLGCGAGKHLPFLGAPVVALDGALAMVRLARETFPAAWPIRSDVVELPFRRGALAAAWARSIYVHIPKVDLPRALADLHRVVDVGAPIDLTMEFGTREGADEDDTDFPGRFFALWEPEPLRDVVVGAGFAVDVCEHDGGEWIEVRATRLRTLPDFVGPGMRLLVVGLNPSEYSADRGFGFARPGNRFWPAAFAAGVVTRTHDPLHALCVDGVGMTDLVKRATPRADGLTTSEYRDGLARVERLVAWLQPRAVCFAGLAGWRAAADRKAVAGVQPHTLGGRPVYVMPNPSGINAHATVATLGDHLRAALALADGAPAD
jgi:TDG/mug DNA glycosylase family protein